MPTFHWLQFRDDPLHPHTMVDNDSSAYQYNYSGTTELIDSVLPDTDVAFYSVAEAEAWTGFEPGAQAIDRSLLSSDESMLAEAISDLAREYSPIAVSITRIHSNSFSPRSNTFSCDRGSYLICLAIVQQNVRRPKNHAKAMLDKVNKIFDHTFDTHRDL